MTLIIFATILIISIIAAYFINHFFTFFVKLAVSMLFLIFLSVLFFGVSWKDVVDWGVALLLWIF